MAGLFSGYTTLPKIGETVSQPEQQSPHNQNFGWKDRPYDSETF